jgi:hypothetical protein
MASIKINGASSQSGYGVHKGEKNKTRSSKEDQAIQEQLEDIENGRETTQPQDS